MGGGISSNRGGEEAPQTDDAPGTFPDLAEATTVSEERPSKRLKTAAHESRSEPDGSGGAAVVADVAMTESEPATESQAPAANGHASGQAEPVNGDSENATGPKATGSNQAVAASETQTADGGQAATAQAEPANGGSGNAPEPKVTDSSQAATASETITNGSQVAAAQAEPFNRRSENLSEPKATDDSQATTVVEIKATNGSQAATSHATSQADLATGNNENASELKATDTSQAAIEPRRPGIAPIKPEYLLPKPEKPSGEVEAPTADESTQENGQDARSESNAPRGKKDKPKKERGQNVSRSFGHFEDSAPLCISRAMTPEFSPANCQYGEKCKSIHDLREYLASRPTDVVPKSESCRLYELFGQCPSGWRCRFVKYHMTTYKHEDGKEELVLTRKKPAPDGDSTTSEHEPILSPYEPVPSSTGNVVSKRQKIDLNRRRVDFSKASQYCTWLDKEAKVFNAYHNRQRNQTMADLRADFVEPPFEPSEKRSLYFGPETPLLAPLTTQGNLPYRRLCIDLGAELTYSEMAMTTPLLKGQNADWTLMRAHESELTPPTVNTVVDNYDNSRDLKFGAQISGHSHWNVSKGASILSRFCPHLRLIDLNCGCPIDMVYKSGAGSGVLESHGKLERMVRGMNAVSGEIPITIKIRTGIQHNRPVATSIISKLAFGAREHRERLGAPGCAAITLHGRSREQRYTKKANWEYIAECAGIVKQYNAQKAALTDTAAEPDARTLPNTKDGRMYFLGNGDCYSHIDYYKHIEEARVDSVMLGRGALIKPWIFEEIKARQYLDKSSSERMEYVKRYVDYGLEAWGSDDIGVGYTRRFLLEWLSFAHRYVPIGLLSHLPPDMNDRPGAYVGRDEFETKLASKNYKDWIDISEHFLGKASPGFKFEPKHKSNAYEAEG